MLPPKGEGKKVESGAELYSACTGETPMPTLPELPQRSVVPPLIAKGEKRSERWSARAKLEGEAAKRCGALG